jgi:hypothetical protein
LASRLRLLRSGTSSTGSTPGPRALLASSFLRRSVGWRRAARERERVRESERSGAVGCGLWGVVCVGGRGGFSRFFLSSLLLLLSLRDGVLGPPSSCLPILFLPSFLSSRCAAGEIVRLYCALTMASSSPRHSRFNIIAE